MPYLARRAQERLAAGKEMDIKKSGLMASPVKFDDEERACADSQTYTPGLRSLSDEGAFRCG